MSKKKVCVVIFSRANYGSIKSVLLQIQKSKKLDLQIILGGSVLVDKYGSTIDLIKKDGFKIHHQISFLVEGETNLTMTKTTGLAILEISTSLDNLKRWPLLLQPHT
jgi:UDP-N-acetylglucosamine 2-epimerase